MKLKPEVLLSSMLLVALLGFAVTAGAEERHDRREAPRGVVLDSRFHHDHYYPPRGYAVGTLPGGAISVSFGGGSFFFHGGVWFRPSGGRFVVVAPPIGIVVPLLPPAYATLWIGGAPYYYANDVYYTPAPGGYAVVAPPPGADTAQAVPPPPPANAPPPPPPPAPAPTAPPRAAEPVIYPRNGQSAQQLEADRQECNRWATTQPSAQADAAVFQRAVAACLDGRGYTVR